MLQLCHVIGEAPQGGQILIDPYCYSEIANNLALISRNVPHKPDYDQLTTLQQCPPPPPSSHFHFPRWRPI